VITPKKPKLFYHRNSRLSKVRFLLLLLLDLPSICYTITLVETKPPITLTTDFGTADGYVGTMKGVMLGIAPGTPMVDISHVISPQNVRQAAYVLYTVFSFFPAGTVHLVVVDPGVGSARRPIALRASNACYVGPDNGVFSYVMASEKVDAIVELSEPRYRLSRVSYTFHGRDVFAPAAAYLAAGVPIASLGPAVTDPVVFAPPRLEVGRNMIIGEVLHVDHFGNVITSIGRLMWRAGRIVLQPGFGIRVDGVLDFDSASARVEVAGHDLTGVHHTYAEVGSGQPLALVGSEGYLEVAVREGNGAQVLGLSPGQEVMLYW